MIVQVIITTVAIVFLLISFVTLLYFLSLYTNKTQSHSDTDKREPKDSIHPHRTYDAFPATRAVIHCNHIPPGVPYKYRQKGYTDCRILSRVFHGNSLCNRGCLGLGTCVRACPVDAISIFNNTILVTDACNGCGYCVQTCPKQLIHIIPVADSDTMRCAAAGFESTAPQWCPTAKNGFLIDYAHLPDSFFKTLFKWFRIKKMPRYE